MNTGREKSYPELLLKVHEDGLCHRCATCIGVCPKNVYAMDEDGYPKIETGDSCVNCGLCLKCCPGLGFDFKALNENPEYHKTHGYFKSAYLSYATAKETRDAGSSGGVISALLIYLLETKQIDGALVLGSDSTDLWKGKPFIARTKEEILLAGKSKYVVSSTNALLKDLLDGGRYAVVGLPCQIQGLVKASQFNKKLADAIVIKIGLFCHAALEDEALKTVYENVSKEVRSSAKRFISRLGKNPGAPNIETKDGNFVPVYFPEKKGFRPDSMDMLNVLFRLYTQPRCFMCVDALAELADISVGDPLKSMLPDNDGHSFVLARSDLGEKILLEATTLQNIKLDRENALKCNRTMAREKKGRAAYLIKKRREKGLPCPDYGLELKSDLSSIALFVDLVSHYFSFHPYGRRMVLKFFLGNVGYLILWANHIRRKRKHG